MNRATAREASERTAGGEKEVTLTISISNAAAKGKFLEKGRTTWKNELKADRKHMKEQAGSPKKYNGLPLSDWTRYVGHRAASNYLKTGCT